MRITLILVWCALLTAMPSAFGQAPATTTPDAARVFQKPPMPGRLVAVDGDRRLHIFCSGPANGPTVIIEAGLTGYPARSTYGRAQDHISSFAHVCTYDRAGLGWSDAATLGRSVPEIQPQDRMSGSGQRLTLASLRYIVSDVDGCVGFYSRRHCIGRRGRQILLEDPSGNVIELFQPKAR
jgi:hypothetical protein